MVSKVVMPKASKASKAPKAPKARKAPKAPKATNTKAINAHPKATKKNSRDFAPDLPKYVALLSASKLANTTKVQNASRLGKLVDATGQPVTWTLGHCVESWASLRKVYGAENYRTLRTFVNLALSMLSNHAEEAGDMSATATRNAHACWTKLYAVVSPLALDHYETNEPTEKMKGSHVPWAELERVRDGLIKERPLGMDTLMLSVYTYLPPSRINFGSMRIYGQKGDAKPPPKPDTAEEKATPNFLAISRVGYTTRMAITISAFKNKSLRFPRCVRELPPPLVSLVERSLLAQPRDWLLVSPRTGEPWKDAGTFGLYMRGALKRIFGKPVTANSLRHAFATALDMNEMSPRDKDEAAAMMMTSGRQLERYRLKLPAPPPLGEKAARRAMLGGGTKTTGRERQLSRRYFGSKWEGVAKKGKA